MSFGAQRKVKRRVVLPEVAVDVLPAAVRVARERILDRLEPPGFVAEATSAPNPAARTSCRNSRRVNSVMASAPSQVRMKVTIDSISPRRAPARGRRLANPASPCRGGRAGWSRPGRCRSRPGAAPGSRARPLRALPFAPWQPAQARRTAAPRAASPFAQRAGRGSGRYATPARSRRYRTTAAISSGRSPPSCSPHAGIRRPGRPLRMVARIRSSEAIARKSGLPIAGNGAMPG